MGLNHFNSDEVYGKFEEQEEDGEARQWAMFERMYQEELKHYRLSRTARAENPTGKEHSKIIGMAPHSLRQADKVARGEVKPADKGLDLKRIWELHEEGFTYKEIGKRLGVCESTIKKKMRKIKAQGKLAWPEGKVFMVFEGRWK